MPKFDLWCTQVLETVNGHSLDRLDADPTKVEIGTEAVAKVVPDHYVSRERVAGVLRRLGKDSAALLVEQKLPLAKAARSGDLGEVLGSEYVLKYMGYVLGVNRLQWKDHRQMPMRGDDIIAFRLNENSKIEFLKGEVKSRRRLSGSTVSQAREALQSNSGRPTPHALSFLADRLHENGDNDLADLIDDSQLSTGIDLKQVSHLIFTFSGNDPGKYLRDDLNAYEGSTPQRAVGLRVAEHQEFIKAVYERVVADVHGG